MDVPLCCFDISMSKHILDNIDWSTCCQGVGTGHMAKSMNGDMWQPDTGNISLKSIIKGVRGHWVNSIVLWIEFCMRNKNKVLWIG